MCALRCAREKFCGAFVCGVDVGSLNAVVSTGGEDGKHRCEAHHGYVATSGPSRELRAHAAHAARRALAARSDLPRAGL